MSENITVDDVLLENEDWVVGFAFSKLPVRGVIARMDGLCAEVNTRRHYSIRVKQWLAEFMLSVSLVRYGIKADGRLSLQLRDTTEHGVRMLLAEANEQLQVRGMAKASSNTDSKAPFDFPETFEALRGSILSLQLEPPDKGVAYQGVVDMQGTELGAALEDYFQQSEQLPTCIQLRAADAQAGGILLQRLPGEMSDDDWQRLQLMAATLANGEVQNNSAHKLLQRLFSEDDLEVFNPRKPQFFCTCSRQRVASMIMQLGEPEAQEVLAERGTIEVACEHCGQQYEFDSIDAEALFAGVLETVIANSSIQ